MKNGEETVIEAGIRREMAALSAAAWRIGGVAMAALWLNIWRHVSASAVAASGWRRRKRGEISEANAARCHRRKSAAAGGKGLA